MKDTAENRLPIWNISVRFLPGYDEYFAPYLLICGLVPVPVISASVNALVINKKLSRTALWLIMRLISG